MPSGGLTALCRQSPDTEKADWVLWDLPEALDVCLNYIISTPNLTYLAGKLHFSYIYL